ncbi:uncharacterized protein PV09_08509 [Verruconis gallopava]|uniref:Transcription factor domain-containing protein n=1 Tax=Verruconis gallopava TaxID=253628 RepID=A0A0D1XC58_9PEZI|nr:uncharacterized protein PV09_08509 [Verruconis gallopava]KIV99840.1 hypothetical protein PV09_08509 [Verruconis gallopava]
MHATFTATQLRNSPTVLRFLHQKNIASKPWTTGASDLNIETDAIMKYLDHIFPFLFPHCRPSLFETGRSWILALLRESKFAYHSVLGLTSFFFTLALTDVYSGTYADCTDQLWARLDRDIHECFQSIQNDLLALCAPKIDVTVCEKVYLMGSIINFIVFECALGQSAGWMVHLPPAIALFKDLLNRPGRGEPKMRSTLLAIGPPIWYKAENETYIWSPEQAGFRFFAALLVFCDIIASTALRKAPQLTMYHDTVLDSGDNGAPVLGFTQIRLSAIVGCPSSVLQAIGQIATLDSWKAEQSAMNDDVQSELFERSSSISLSLANAEARLELNHLESAPHSDPLLPFRSYAVRVTTASPYRITTSVWISAAQIYLSLVVNGFRWSDASIHDLVANILRLIPLIPSNEFRTLAWPLCVAGCLASQSQESYFREIFATKKILEIIGSPKEAIRVVEKVWKSRSNIDEKTWSLASCLGILGNPLLLI